MSEAGIERLRAICMALPEATEGGGVGNPTFRVRDKIFAMQHPVDGRASMWFKAPRGMQEAVVGGEPERFFVPPYVGHHGWIGAWLDTEQDWTHITEMVEQSYRMTAPKKLIAALKERFKGS